MFTALITEAFRFTAIYLFGSTGETLTEKSGNLNLGIPGIMCFGATGAVIGEYVYELAIGGDVSKMQAFPAIVIPLLFSMLFAGALGAFYCLLTVTLRCNQNVTGLTITTFGVGVLSYFKGVLGTRATFAKASLFFTDGLDFADKLGWIGKVFLSHGFMIYLAIAISLLVAFVLKKTRTGLSLQAVGENSATADAAGISVTTNKYVATILGSMIAGFGGVFYIFDYLGGVIPNDIEAFGWLAIAIVIFSVWRPNLGILASFIFATLYLLKSYVAPYLSGIEQAELIKMIPYVVTILVLIVTSIVNKKETQPPASLGLSYFREER